MEEMTFITIDEFCLHYNVPLSFISSLEEIELIEIIPHVEDESVRLVKVGQLKQLEKLIRLHFELDINVSGLDVINNLLNQIQLLQQENRELKNRLRIFE
jgi:hypothetical protein